MAAATPGEVVVVAECPSLDYLPALHGAVDSVSQLADDAEGGQVKVVVHLTCEAVARSPEYQAWLARLPTWDHVMAGRGYDAAVDAPSLYSAHQMQVWRHLQCAWRSTTAELTCLNAPGMTVAHQIMRILGS